MLTVRRPVPAGRTASVTRDSRCVRRLQAASLHIRVVRLTKSLFGFGKPNRNAEPFFRTVQSTYSC